MANWQEPKTTWQAGDIPGAGDFNRIEENEEYLKQQAKNISVITGTINHGGTIPLPAGYTEDQCKWFVSPNDLEIAGGASADDVRIHCYTSGRTVYCYCDFVNSEGQTGVYYGTANYMVIGIKSV